MPTKDNSDIPTPSAVTSNATPSSSESSSTTARIRARSNTQTPNTYTLHNGNAKGNKNSKVQKRTRPIKMKRNCEPCTRAKVKCDGALPCSRCVARGYANMCGFLPKKSRWDRDNLRGSLCMVLLLCILLRSHHDIFASFLQNKKYFVCRCRQRASRSKLWDNSTTTSTYK